MAHIDLESSTTDSSKTCSAENTLPGHVYILKTMNGDMVLLRMSRDLRTFGTENANLFRETVPFVVLVDPKGDKVGSYGDVIWLTNIIPVFETGAASMIIR